MLFFSWEIYVTLLISLRHAYCSVVMEASSQKSIYVSDYCPKMKYCAEGAHVMCMYYNPNRVMGPRCTKPKNVSVTPHLAEQLLEITNTIRSKVALGKEKGKNGEVFPRGYGIYRLKWDSELATFAQVLANQCLLRHDMCRATKQFPDPGQTAGLVRFTYPDWIPVNKNSGLEKPGLTLHKLEYAIKQALRSWYRHKADVSTSMIMSAPDWTEIPEKQSGRHYLEMIYGPATHMGCGMSAYTEYAFYEKNVPLNYHAIQIVCNYSSRSRAGGPVYEVAPPTQVGYTIKCGCPEGMDEDADCLCYESSRNAIKRPDIGRSCSNKAHNCKPSVVLLPIFTVENAPPDKLALRSGIEEKKESDMEIMDLYQPSDNQTIFQPLVLQKPSYHRALSNIIKDAKPSVMTSFPGNSIAVNNNKPLVVDHTNYNNPLMYQPAMQRQEIHSLVSNLINEVQPKVDYPLSTVAKPHIFDVKNRFFDKTHTHPSYDSKKSIPTLSSHGLTQIKKESVFSKVPTFELSKVPQKSTKPKSDVQPRKDFSRVKSLVKSYLNLRRHKDTKTGVTKSSVDFLKFLNDHSKTTTEPYLQLQHSAEEKLINYNSLLSNKLEPKTNKHYKDTFTDIESDSSKEKSNDKLMNLLDKLEQEVKHIELDKSKKEIFDAKIRKIYGSVVGKSELPSHKANRDTDVTDTELSDLEKYKSDHARYSDLENNVREKLSQNHESDRFESIKNYNIDRRASVMRDDTQNEIRPINRNLNTIADRFIDKPIKDRKDYEIELKRIYSDNENIKSKYSRNIFNDAEEIKTREFLNEKEALRAKQLYTEAEEKKKIKDLEKRQHTPLSDHEDDPLSIDRRKFYQDKLDKIVRKVHNTRKFKHHSDPISNPLIRPIIRPSINDETLRPGKSQANPFYIPDRARFLHGF